MTQDVPYPPSIVLNGDVLRNVEKFQYLCSVITSNQVVDDEISARIG